MHSALSVPAFRIEPSEESLVEGLFALMRHSGDVDPRESWDEYCEGDRRFALDGARAFFDAVLAAELERASVVVPEPSDARLEPEVCEEAG